LGLAGFKKVGQTKIQIVPPNITEEERRKRIDDVKHLIIRLWIETQGGGERSESGPLGSHRGIFRKDRPRPTVV